jgi:superfamily II RNA helicase
MMKLQAINESRERFLKGIGIPQKGTFVVDDFQREAISNLAAGIDTLVVAPTGSGKTYIAIEGMRNALRSGNHVVYTTPLKALSNTKYSEFQQIFGPEFTVGLLTGDRKIEGDSHVVIATTEIYRNELYRGSGRYGVVVLDEVHYIADPQRGAVWEESIILTPSSTTLLMLSASISNAEEIASWIEEVRNKECRIVRKIERPVELRYGFLHPRYGVIPLSDEKGHLSPEVSHFYAATDLDDTGMQLRGEGKSEQRSGGRSGGPRGGGSRGGSSGGSRGGSRSGGRGGSPSKGRGGSGGGSRRPSRGPKS